MRIGVFFAPVVAAILRDIVEFKDRPRALHRRVVTAGHLEIGEDAMAVAVAAETRVSRAVEAIVEDGRRSLEEAGTD